MTDAQFWSDGYVAPGVLIPHPRNPKKHPPEQIAQIRANIREFGFTRPVLITADYLLLAGHGATEAAVLEGLARIPYRMRAAEHPLSDTQVLALLVADNRLPQNGTWDEVELAAILGELKGDADTLELTGFSLEEADALLAGFGAPAGQNQGQRGEPTAGGYGSPTGAGSLVERFLVAPFSVLNAREGWWQSRKAAWLALGIRSEIGRGANLIGRSPQELFCHFTGIPYEAARAIVSAAMAEQGEAFDVDALIDQHGRKAGADFTRSGAVVPNGPGGLVAQLGTARGYDKLAPGGTGKNSAWLRRGDAGYAPTPGGINSTERPAFEQGAPGNVWHSKQAADPDFYRKRERDPYAVGEQSAGGNATFERLTAADPSFYAQKRAAEERLGRELTTAEFVAEHYEAPASAVAGAGTSIFDPVLCELAYRWFAPPEGSVLDPFAGGSVRGIVAAKLGRSYCGVELRGEQIAANDAQARDILGPEAGRVRYVEGDSRGIGEQWFNSWFDDGAAPAFDFLFTCPPYFDLEQYSDDPRDLSNMTWAEFLAGYDEIIRRAAALLREDRFALFVVGEVRDRDGIYRGLVPATIRAFEAAGLRFYNEAILVTAVGSLPIRAGRTFAAGRKLGKTHQNVLVFVKGDGARAAQACGVVDVVDPLELVEAGVIETGALTPEEVRAMLEADGARGVLVPLERGESFAPLGGEV